MNPLLSHFAVLVVGAALGACGILAAIIWRDRSLRQRETPTIDSDCNPV
jgi:hypothetical protein